MTISVDLQIASGSKMLPAHNEIESWVAETLNDLRKDAELTVRIVDELESRKLNKRWRKSSGPTNVLSFPAEGTASVIPGLLGDIVICAPVVEKEAEQQNKKLHEHWAHMVIHGTLHLVGYDHMDEVDAEKMEALEIRVLDKLGYSNPYI